MQDCKFEEFRIEVTGGQIYGRRWTPASNTDLTPIVLLHDSLGCVSMWRDFPAQLAIRLGRSVLAYDRLGFGQSSERQSPLSLRFINEEAETVFPELCRTLGLKEVIPFGHSVGGGMAIAIASHRSPTGLCVGVITESAQAFVERRTTAGILAAKQLFDAPEQFAKLTKYHGAKARWVLEAWTQTWLDPKFADWCLDDHLTRVQCPVLAIHGDQDEYGSCAFPRRIATRVAGYSQAVILEGVGHVPHRENPDELIDAVGAFLAEVANGRGVAAGA
jgi:pimeloyl-ACP methyl ester carboxylesterase